MKWYKRDPHAALEGMAELTLEECGAYNIVLDVLYARDLDVPADERFWTRHLRCRPQVWRRLKAALIAKGKLHETGGKLTANRVETEVKSALKLIENMGHLGALSAQKRNKNNGAAPTAPLGTTTTTTTTRKNSVRAQAPRLPSKEADLFSRGREVLGEKSGGLIAKLLKHKNGDAAEALGIIENAADTDEPREYVGAALRRKDGGWQ